MTDKEKYRLLCRTEKTIPIYSRDWWLDVVCGKDKWELLWIEEKGHVQAAMPLYIPHRGIISMPPYSQTMGPWFAPTSTDTKYTTRLGQQQELCKQLVESLKAYPHFLQNFSHTITDWLPFYWAGYRQTTRYTYILPDIHDSANVWDSMSVHTRRNITKAAEKNNIQVKRGISVDEFMQVYQKTFIRQGKKPVNPEILKQLITVCRQQEQGDLWGGYDKAGNLHAAVFIAWQENSAYYMAGGGDPIYRTSGAHSLVMWEAIQYVSAKSEQFDFEGSMIPGVERFFREFGAIQTPFFTITKGKLSLIHRAWLKLKSLK